MTKTSRRTRIPWSIRLQFGFAGSVVLLTVFLFIPIHTALSAGMAGISLVLFGTAIVILLGLLLLKRSEPRWLLAVALVAALLGCTVPQLAFVQLARVEQTKLSFDPLAYVSFSGATTMETTRTMVYKTTGSGNLHLAYYQSAHPGKRPVVVLLHGGGWRFGDHLETGVWPQLLTEAGFSVVSIQYRLSSDTHHTWRDAPEDVHDAINYTRAHASDLSIDPSRVHLLGQSAGGHLALLEAYRYHDVRSVVSLYAPTDLTLDFATSRDKTSELDFLGGPPAQYPNRYTATSPITHVSPASPSSFIVQGERDDLVATQNAVILADALERNKVEHDVLFLPMTGHSFENQRGGFASQIAKQLVLRFLKK
jgi:acetyl esterase